MRIGLTGAGGTGKTTLARILSQRTGIPFIPSVARGVFEAWGWTEERQRTATPEEKWRLQKAIFDAKLQQEQDLTTGISDRTLLDHLVYTSYRCYDFIDRPILDSLEALTVENLKKLDLVVYVELFDWDPSPDDLREDSRAYRFVQDLMFRGFLEKHEILYAKTLNGSPADRLESLMGLLDTLEGVRRAAGRQAG